MSVYCVSDIHGYYSDFMKLLDKVSPNEEDIIYVLGDIIDRGNESVQMLKWAVDEANSNVKFLLGNHEDMSAAVIIGDPIGLKMHKDMIWTYNGGIETRNQLIKETDEAWRVNKLVPWLAGLPLYDVVEAGGINWMLVHAGLNCCSFDKKNYFFDFSDGNFDEHSRQETVDLSEYGFGKQWAQSLLWQRYQWLGYRKLTPMPVVFGHTPIGKDFVEHCRFKDIPCAGGDGRMFYIYNRVCIDCGCACREASSANWNLGMLRLDDMKAFYLKDKNIYI